MKLSALQGQFMLTVLLESLPITNNFSYSREQRITVYNEIMSQQSN
jgi:hypothetical protein